MKLTDIANFRYSTKEFDTTKKISEDDFQEILNVMRLSPSSVNSQPWHFIVASTEEGKKRIAKGAGGFYAFNEEKILDASHVILFASKDTMDENYLEHLLEKEDQDGRFAEEEHKEMVRGGRGMFANMHKDDWKDEKHWLQKQVYLNMGVLLLGAGAMEIDSLPMEGVDLEVLDQEFGLKEKGFSSVGVVALGYRKEKDFNAALPKSRLEEDEIFTFLK